MCSFENASSSDYLEFFSIRNLCFAVLLLRSPCAGQDPLTVRGEQYIPTELRFPLARIRFRSRETTSLFL